MSMIYAQLNTKRIRLMLALLTLLLTACVSKKPGAWQSNNLPHAESTIKKVALLLPLSGKYKEAGQALRNSFLSRYYEDQSATKPTIKIYDSATGLEMYQILETIVHDGANVIVGPLQKQHVDALTKIHTLPIPILALNKSTLPNKNVNLVEFGLSPQDEAEQIAEVALTHGLKNAMIISPTGDWGETVSHHFLSAWQRGGGQLCDQLRYDSQQKLSLVIQSLLDIDASKQRIATLKRLLGHKLKAIPRRRKDFDMVFLVASSKTAREIRPLLKFYYAADIPVYSTSAVYPGISSVKRDNDINDVIFMDMPWTIAPNKQMEAARATFQTRWPQSFQQFPRLYALGLDSYDLLSHLPELSQNPDYRFPGATGILRLTEENEIYRTLQLAKIRQGKISAIFSP